MEWLALAPLSLANEVEIVKAHLNQAAKKSVPNVAEIVALMRITRTHPKLRRGASIRAAIAMAKILESTDTDFWTVAKSVLANRVELEVGKFSNRPYSDLLDELIEELKIELKKKP